jgi:5'-deoxynucleotidase YfbR-like HD superfamily hydrolase
MKPFIETFSGRTFAPLHPNFADVRIEDVAHALSNQCRYSGHCRFHYSVAEHSVRVAELLAAEGEDTVTQLWGLLHDASEAYLVDLPTPLKLDPLFASVYRRAERRLMRAVCKRFSLPEREPAAVREADRRMLATEVRDLMHGDRDYWKKIDAVPWHDRIRPWGAGVAEFEFLRTYRFLTGDKR